MSESKLFYCNYHRNNYYAANNVFVHVKTVRTADIINIYRLTEQRCDQKHVTELLYHIISCIVCKIHSAQIT